MTPLVGTRIVDLTRHAPGPYASLVCAALGADVIKVEAPAAGDPLRQMDSRAFDRLNRGKKSVVLDLKTEDGGRALRRLCSSASVVIEGFRPGVMARLGLDYASIRKSSPKIIYVSVSGFGQSGPLAARSAHDVNYMAAAGALHGLSSPLPLQVADFSAGGLYAVVAILSALLERDGRYIDLSMHEGILSLARLAEGGVADALSGRYPNYSVYETRDGKGLTVGALEAKFWKAFCDAVARPEWTPRRLDPGLRAEVAELVRTRDRDAWEELFADIDACVEVVRSPGEAFTHPQATHRRQTLETFQLPFGVAHAELSPAPSLGEHTEEILASLG